MWQRWWNSSRKRTAGATPSSCTPPRSASKKRNDNRTPTRASSSTTAAASNVAFAPAVPIDLPPDSPNIPNDLLHACPIDPSPKPPIDLPPKPPIVTPRLGLRSFTDAHKHRDTIMPGVDLCGLPTGPFETEADIISAVKGWAANPTTNGGAFGIRNQTFVKENNVRGFHRLLVCDREGVLRPKTQRAVRRPNQISKRCDCKWAIWIEQVAEGWTTVEMPKPARAFMKERNLDRIAMAHNHELLRTPAEINTNCNLRSITGDMKDVADTMWKAGNSPGQIFAFLSKLCQQKGIPVSFTGKDIYNFCASKKDRDSANT